MLTFPPLFSTMISSPRFISLVLAATLVLFAASCEQHSWEETKKLHHHGDEHAEEGHGDDHDAESHGEADKDNRDNLPG